VDAIVAGIERDGYWTIQTGLSPENPAGRRASPGWGRDTLFLEGRSTRC